MPAARTRVGRVTQNDHRFVPCPAGSDDENHVISFREWQTAWEHDLGFCGPQYIIYEIFDSLDFEGMC